MPRAMILTCPACSSRYLIEPEALGAGGRAVRCAGCGHRWFVAPPWGDAPRGRAPAAAAATGLPPSPGGASAAAAATAAPEEAAATDDEPPPQPTGDPGRSRGLIAWLALVLLALMAAGAVVGRNEVVASFPEAAPIYGRLGLPVALPLGLDFRGVTSSRLADGDVEVLVVEGEIVNVTGQGRIVPRVRVALLDADGRELEHELFAADGRRLEGGAATRFTARLVNPPEQARNFEVTFAADAAAGDG